MRILLVVYDNESYINWFPQGLGYIAAVLLNEGYDVEVYSGDRHHYPEEHLTAFLNENRFDVIGVSVIAGYYQYKKLLKISDAINKSRQRPFYVIGGHGPSHEPKYFMLKTNADAVVIGEGEETIKELMKAISNKKSFHSIKGIAFRDGNTVVINERRPLIKDVDSILPPAYHLFPIDYYRLLRPPNIRKDEFTMPVLSGRGCTFKCSFCYRMDDGFRPRSDESIIEEITFLKKAYGINFILFSDELLMSSSNRTVSLCEKIISQKLNIRWSCNGRLNYATSKVLDAMKRAGCVYVNYGIEAMDDEVLKMMRKNLTVRQIIQGVEATIAAGITPGLNIIFGNFGDTTETLKKGVDFLLQYDDAARLRTIRPVTPYPRSPLYYQAIEKGLLNDVEDFYECKHINSDLLSVNFTEMSETEFHGCLLEANKRLIEHYYSIQKDDMIREAENLYNIKNPIFRGFRQQ